MCAMYPKVFITLGLLSFMESESGGEIGIGFSLCDILDSPKSALRHSGAIGMSKSV